MDDDIILPGGIFVKKKQHFVDLLEKVRSENNDHTTGFHLSEEDLEVVSSDRQDMAKCLHVLSERYGNISCGVSSFIFFFAKNEQFIYLLKCNNCKTFDNKLCSLQAIDMS